MSSSHLWKSFFAPNHASRVPFHNASFCPPRVALRLPHDCPMDTDVSTLRAQLKAFEREFKARHHHPPSVDDIKNAGFGAT